MVNCIVSLLTLKPARSADCVFDSILLARDASLHFLTKTLILTLFLLSAITFSTESIPNFQPDCEVSQSRKSTIANTIKIILPRIIPSQKPERTLSRSYSPSLPVVPPSNRARFITPSRAPPNPLF